MRTQEKLIYTNERGECNCCHKAYKMLRIT